MDLTKEDWESRAADISVVSVAIAIIFVLVVAVAVVLVVAPIVVLVFVLVVALTFDVVDDPKYPFYYIVRFPGAVWHHYLRRG